MLNGTTAGAADLVGGLAGDAAQTKLRWPQGENLLGGDMVAVEVWRSVLWYLTLGESSGVVTWYSGM